MAPVAGLMLAAVAVGTALKAGGQVQQAQNQQRSAQVQANNMRAQAGYQANVVQESAQMPAAESQAAQYNAEIARQQAVETEQQYAENERRLRLQGAEQIGQMRANFGASGLTLDGSAQDALLEKAANNELDALTLRHEGLLKSQGFLNSAALGDFQASQGQYQSNEILQRAHYLRGSADAPAAEVERSGARQAEAGYLNAGVTLLGAAPTFSQYGGQSSMPGFGG